MDIDLALKINKFVHDNCKDVPHDFGLTVIKIIEDHNSEKTGPPLTATGIHYRREIPFVDISKLS